MTAAEFVQEEVIARRWSAELFKSRSGLSREQINNFFSNNCPITPEIAKGLSQAFGTHLDYWLHLEEAIKILRL